MSHPDCDNCPRVHALEARIERLERALHEARCAAGPQAAPFSRGRPKPNLKRPDKEGLSLFIPA